MAPALGAHKAELETQGFTRFPGFYSVAELAPLKQHIVAIVASLHLHHLGRPLPSQDFDSDIFQTAYLAMVRHDRKLGSIVYDAVKQIPEFMRITSSTKNVELAQSLRGTASIGINRGGDGIRIDYPSEEKFMSPWHQEFPTQLGSPDGLVYWSPLVNITADIGPLEVCPGSHKEGFIPITYDTDEQKSTAYNVRLADEAGVIGRYAPQQLLCDAGDLLVLDFLTLHRSGFNHANRARWTMQLRYFNFENAEARALGWPVNIGQGNRPEKFFPDKVVRNA